MTMKMTVRIGIAGTVALLMAGCPSVGGSGDGSRVVKMPRPTGLACTGEALDVFLSWVNAGAYSKVQIKRDGSVIAMLPGNAQSFSETLSASGTSTYGVAGVDAKGRVTPPAQCQATTVSVPELGSLGSLACTFAPRDYQVALSWAVAGAEFDAFRIARDSVQIAEVDGATTTFVDSAPTVGSRRYEVRGVAAGNVSTAAACTITVTALGQIASFASRVDTATGDIVLTWTNGELYDGLELSCGGNQLAALSGNQTTYTFSHQNFGVYEFALRGTFGARQTAAATTSAAVGRLVWDADATGTAAGYHVYVWPAAEAAPALTGFAYTTGLVTTLPLADLFGAGALPTSSDPLAFNIALTAFDAAGNESTLSEEIAFQWQVLSAQSLP